MTIQILGLRSFFKKETGEEITYDAFHNENWRAPNLKHLFENLDQYIAKIPEKERWNLFYTVSNCKAKKRDFDYLEHIAWDIDKLDLHKLNSYIPIVISALGLPNDKVQVIGSGNGLHFVIALSYKISKDKHAELRTHYKALCAKVDAALSKANLPGQADTAVWDKRRILRLPGTENRKPNKPKKRCTLIQGSLTPLDYKLENYSGVPTVAPGGELPKSVMSKYPEADSPAVVEGCPFLQFAKNQPGDLSEPLWYSAISILARLDNGRDLAHEYSKGHPNYSQQETEQKIEQALTAAGPSTCARIGETWGGCKDCPHYGKISSPILIVGPDYIKTEKTGFHHVLVDSKGNPKYVPCYEDLMKYFQKQHPYRGLDSSRMVYVYNGQHWKEWGASKLEEFAQTHFKPFAKNVQRSEFKNLIQCTNITELEWFEDTIKRKINFKNGVLDMESNVFSEHSHEYGFRHVLPYDYDPDARAPLFEHMLEKITCGDKELAKVILEFTGYALSNDDYWLHKALVLVGEGSNGKSTYLNILKHLVGNHNYSGYTIEDLERSEYARQGLDGMMFNLTEEMGVQSLKDSSMFKRLIGGAALPVRKIYSEPYMITNKAKIVITCNELPEHNDLSHGLKRRLLIVPFNHKFSSSDKDFDPHIDAKLLQELPGIFNMAYQNYVELLKNKAFSESKAVSLAVQDFMEQADTVLQWVRNSVYIDDSAHQNGEPGFSTVSELYEDYTKFCDNHLGVYPIKRIPFGRKLISHVPNGIDRYVKKRHQGAQPRVMCGVFSKRDHGDMP